MRVRTRIPVVLITASLTIAACAIAETKLPPDPTVEYLPCLGMDLDPAQRVDPLPVLLQENAELEDDLWGGFWEVGAEWHIGLTDVGAVDWQMVCPRVQDPEIVVHEVPFPLAGLEAWSRQIDEAITASDDPGSVSQGLVVISGQYAIEIRAPSVESASGVAEGVPLEAWAYGGPVSLGSG